MDLDSYSIQYKAHQLQTLIGTGLFIGGKFKPRRSSQYKELCCISSSVYKIFILKEQKSAFVENMKIYNLKNGLPMHEISDDSQILCQKGFLISTPALCSYLQLSKIFSVRVQQHGLKCKNYIKFIKNFSGMTKCQHFPKHKLDFAWTSQVKQSVFLFRKGECVNYFKNMISYPLFGFSDFGTFQLKSDRSLRKTKVYNTWFHYLIKQLGFKPQFNPQLTNIYTFLGQMQKISNLMKTKFRNQIRIQQTICFGCSYQELIQTLDSFSHFRYTLFKSQQLQQKVLNKEDIISKIDTYICVLKRLAKSSCINKQTYPTYYYYMYNLIGYNNGKNNTDIPEAFKKLMIQLLQENPQNIITLPVKFDKRPLENFIINIRNQSSLQFAYDNTNSIIKQIQEYRGQGQMNLMKQQPKKKKRKGKLQLNKEKTIKARKVRMQKLKSKNYEANKQKKIKKQK